MKCRASPLNHAAFRAGEPPALPGLAGGLLLCGLLAACSPAPDTTTPPPPPKAAPPAAAASVVSIPEEFLSPTPAPRPPVLPRVVFATSDFQVTTRHGIQGIRAGEAMNFLREEGGDYVVQYRDMEFQKNRSYFAATYVEPSRPEPTPPAGGSEPVAGLSPAETTLSAEPRLSGPIPGDDPASVAGQKKVGDLTDAIRALNDQIRSAQEEADKQSARTNGEKPAAADVKKSSRAIQKLKEKRDELSGQLTEMGKP